MQWEAVRNAVAEISVPVQRKSGPGDLRIPVGEQRADVRMAVAVELSEGDGAG